MAIKDYSTTPANNTSLFPEGMNPADLNNGMRQVQTDIRGFYETPQWRDLGNVPTRASATTFTTPGDVTSIYPVGMRLRLTDTAAFLYGTITAASYSAPNTTITVALDSGVLTSNLTAFAAGFDPRNASIAAGSIGGSFDTLAIQGATAAEGVNRFSADAVGGSIAFSKSRNATVGSETAVISGDVLARITAAGSDGASRAAKASIQAIVNGTVTTGSVPTDLVISTGSTAETEHLRVSSTGDLTITGDNGSNLDILLNKLGAGSEAVFLTFQRNSITGGVIFLDGANNFVVRAQAASPSLILQSPNATTAVVIGDTSVVSNSPITSPSTLKARAKVTLSGTAVTVANSFGVTSVVRNGVGDYTVNLSTAVNNISWNGYAYVAGATVGTGIFNEPATPPTSTAIRVVTVRINSTGNVVAEATQFSVEVWGS